MSTSTQLIRLSHGVEHPETLHVECELLARHRFKTQVEARMAIFEFIEGWYNPHRRHYALAYPSPINYERNHPSEGFTASPPPSTQPG